MGELRYTLRNAFLAFRAFGDDDFVLAYDSITGDTHLLEILGYELCLALAENSATLAELKDYLALRFSDDDCSSIAEAVDMAIAHLEGANLIRSIAN